MFNVVIPASLAYRLERCNESPWGNVEVFNSELYQWLDVHATPSGWDHDFHTNGRDCVVTLSDPKVALLFKLTWGGQ